MEEQRACAYPLDLDKNEDDILFQDQGIPMLRSGMQKHFSNTARLRDALQ